MSQNPKDFHGGLGGVNCQHNLFNSLRKTHDKSVFFYPRAWERWIITLIICDLLFCPPPLFFQSPLTSFKTSASKKKKPWKFVFCWTLCRANRCILITLTPLIWPPFWIIHLRSPLKIVYWLALAVLMISMYYLRCNGGLGGGGVPLTFSAIDSVHVTQIKCPSVIRLE